MVATSAKSLSKGAAGDLIAVETLEPRKKIIARVARSGLVEIFTRPPRVR
jgi:flagella basal body P-ring formation protein FlgA